VWASLAVAVLSGAIWLALLAANIYGAPVDEVWRNGGVWTVAMQTRFGQVSMARLALAVLLAGWMVMLAGAIARDRWGAFPVILAIGFLIGPAWTGHAGATPGGAGQIPLAADALQLLGIASAGALLASGIINTWYEVGSPRDLIATAYGRLVLAKIALFAAMVSIAAVNRFHLTPRLAARPAPSAACNTTAWPKPRSASPQSWSSAFSAPWRRQAMPIFIQLTQPFPPAPPSFTSILWPAWRT